MLAACKLVDLAVHAGVLAIGIVKQRRGYKHVVERAVEDSALLGIGGLDADAAQLTLPLLLGHCTGSLEVVARHLCLEVGERVGGGHTGDADAHEQLLARSGVVVEGCLERSAGSLLRACRQHGAILLHVCGSEGLGELGGEVDAPAVGPVVDGAAA